MKVAEADPVAALLALVDARLAATRPPEARMGLISALSPLTVVLDTGQALVPSVGSYTAANVAFAVGDRVIAVPIQRGHDWFVVPAKPG